MLRHRALFVGALLIIETGRAGSALADVEPNPLVEMRAAAEALSDIEPEPPARPGNAVLAKAPDPSPRPVDRKQVLREAMREAVRAEVAHERGGFERASANRGAAKADKGGNGSNGDGGNGASAQARAAAAQAQAARRNSDVAKEHGKALGNQDTPPGKRVGQGGNAKF